MIKIEKFRQAMNEISAKKGKFEFFGLFQYESAPDQWDLVVSARWMEGSRLKGLREFVDLAAPLIGNEDMRVVSKVVPLNHDNPYLREILETVGVDNGWLTLATSVTLMPTLNTLTFFSRDR